MNNKKVKTVFFGTPAYVVPIVKALYDKFDLAAVVTSTDKKVGRNQDLTPSPVKKWSTVYKIPVFTPEKFDAELISKLLKLKPSLFVVASYGKIIPREILDIPKFGAINIHPSLLPKYRGPSPIQQAILNGDKKSGISIIKMDEKMDHGPIIYAEAFRLSSLDTFDSLSTKMFARSAEILVNLIPQFVQNLIPAKPQNDKKATYTKIVKKEDGFFDIDKPPSVKKLDQMIRAYYPWPNVWTKWNGKIVKFYPDNIVQIEGKKLMMFKDFLNGYPNFPLKLI